jgi:hypothetical protein
VSGHCEIFGVTRLGEGERSRRGESLLFEPLRASLKIRANRYSLKAVFITLTILLLCAFAITSQAATLTWTGGGADNLASNPSNWSGNAVPQNGDEIIFDGTSTKDCTWDLNIMLSSVTITSAYTGTITLNPYLSIAEVIVWTGGGTDNLASNPANWSGNRVPQGGDKVVFNETSSKDCIWDIDISPALFSLNTSYSGTVTLNTGLTITGNLTVAGGALNLNDRNLTVDGYLLIGSEGILYATSSTITVKGDWANVGTFDPGTSTVVLSGTNQTIYGNTTFYNLIKIVTTADTLYFEAGSTQIILNNLTFQGADGNLLALRSTVDGQSWYIDPQGTRNISYVDIKDMYNINFVHIVVLNSVDSGNNTKVSFGGSECACWRNKLILSQVIRNHWRHI